ncbi:MAG: response regulator [Desulfobacteraceae bacterium]|nr:response regulator [Desulfobacteraceae bacterium]
MQKQFEVVSETIPVTMIVSTEKGEILFSNLNAQEVFGYSAGAFKGVEAFSLYDAPGDRDALLEILSSNGEVSGFRTTFRKADGTVFPAALFGRMINFDGRDSVLIVVYDLTKVMALEKQLRQTQKLKAIGVLTSGIAHDFNNLLSIIFGYTERAVGLLDSEKDNEKIECLENVLKAADRAKIMIMQMLDFCRQTEKEKKPFHVSNIVSEVVKMMKDLTPSNIDIRSHIKNNDMIIMGDPIQIHQVVTNLVTNSVHVLEDRGGIIEVNLEKAAIVEGRAVEMLTPNIEPGTYAKITVKDNGPGILKEIIHSIFDPFFTTNPVGKGSGLGLSVVHGIVLGHKGAVGVESEPGEGARFYCYFPVIEEKHEADQPDVKLEIPGGGDERILLVDDEPMLLSSSTNLLQDLGYRVTSCGESRKALAVFTNHPEDFDLVITDNIMPEMSGIELSREMLKIRPDIPIILVTGLLTLDEVELKKAGIRGLLKKPFFWEKMQSVIREILDVSV